MSKSVFLLRDGQIFAEYKDEKEIKAAAKAGQLPPGNYTALRTGGSFTVKEVPSRVSVSFQSASTRKKREPGAEAPPAADTESQPRKKRGGLFGN